MKLIPILYIEDRLFFGLVPRIDFAVFMVTELIISFFRTVMFSFPYWVEFSVLVLFIGFLIFKRSLEKKEQALFAVLWANSRIPNAVAGVFRQKRLLGVHRDVV